MPSPARKTKVSRKRAVRKTTTKTRKKPEQSVKITAEIAVQIQDLHEGRYNRTGTKAYRTLKVIGDEVTADDCDGDVIARFKLADFLKAVGLINDLHSNPSALLEHIKQ